MALSWGDTRIPSMGGTIGGFHHHGADPPGFCSAMTVSAFLFGYGSKIPTVAANGASLAQADIGHCCQR
jgi:hypothetical protein